MKLDFKKIAECLKAFVATWKVYLIFSALLFGTNGAQMYAMSETEKPATVNYKTDNSYCDKILNKHENGDQH